MLWLFSIFHKFLKLYTSRPLFDSYYQAVDTTVKKEQRCISWILVVEGLGGRVAEKGTKWADCPRSHT